jgi:hypothetical protein
MNKRFVLACACVAIGTALTNGKVSGQVSRDSPNYPVHPGLVLDAMSDQANPASAPARLGETKTDREVLSCPTDGDANCTVPSQVWARADYLLWFLKPVCLKPPTLTLGSPADPMPGALGQPNTQEILGDHKFEFHGASGIRPSIGCWLTADAFLSLEAEGFVLERVVASEAFQATNGSPATYLPFQDPTNVNRALPFTIPGVVNGSSVGTGSSRLWGLETDLAGYFHTTSGGVVLSGAVLLGFRYLNLEDQVTLTNQLSLVSNPAAFAFGSDRFTTHNQFYGPQVGTRLGLAKDRWSLELVTKMALGETHQVSDVLGSPLLGGSVVSTMLLPGPFLALASNIGRQSADRITLVPEMALTVHYNVTESVSVSLGYSALYWNKVLCPGDQMDGHVNVTELPFHGPPTGPAAPAPQFVHTDAFAQGVNTGVEFRF